MTAGNERRFSGQSRKLEPIFAPGYLGDCHHTLRTREVFKYFQPKHSSESNAPITGNDRILNKSLDELVASHDPVLVCLANLTSRILDCQRSMITVVGAGVSYIIAESTRTLSIDFPHTQAQGEGLWLGGGGAFQSVNGFCEHVCALVPPEDPVDGEIEPLMLEIRDLTKDPKFGGAEHNYKWPWQRFYAGVPLRTKNGVSIGTCCVLDDKPRPDGLTDEQKVALGRMSDIVMDYLETSRVQRDAKRCRGLEMGLSRFIVEGFMSDGVEITEQRDGRLWSEGILKQRRAKEIHRKKMVDKQRRMVLAEVYSDMVKKLGGDSQSSSDATQSSESTNAVTPERKLSIDLEEILEETSPFSNVESPLPTSKIITPTTTIDDGINLKTPHPTQKSQDRDSIPREAISQETRQTRGVVSLITREPAISLELRDPIKSDEPFSLNPKTSDIYRPLKLPQSQTDLTSLITPIDGQGNICDSAISSDTEVHTDIHTTQRLSNYERSSTFEPSFRAMFTRAAKLIRQSVEADVVFVDGDLEGLFGTEESDKSYGFSHVSTDKNAESATRASRPKWCRQRSGILGYATAAGCSESGSVSASRRESSSEGPTPGIEDMGFDVGELSEITLNRIVAENPQGRIIATVGDYFGRAGDIRPQENETEQVLSRFLPGCMSVVFVPMYDHNQKLFAACFVWTRSETRTFFGDVEGSFISAVTNSIMAESMRLNILNADKAKGEFISSISHDLRSPLHGILASATFLGESNLNQLQRSFNDTVISCGKTLLDTINHVLDFQKLSLLQDRKLVKCEVAQAVDSHSNGAGRETPRETQNFVDTDLSTLVQEVTEGVCLGYEFNGFSEPPLAETSGQRRPITVIVDIDKRIDGWVFSAHPAALKRIINNLTGNSMKYTESGWIRIRLQAIDLPPDSYGNRKADVKISVEDSGKGIGREFLKTKLFTPFSQENPLTAGSGLGMSIVRQIVGLMDGKVDVKSQVGRGTKVTVEMQLLCKPIQADSNKLDSPSQAVSELEMRKLVAGKAVTLIGFNLSDPQNLRIKSSEVRALILLRKSLERCASEIFGMRIVPYSQTNPPDFVFANEVDMAIGRSGPPIVAICSHSLVGDVDTADRNGRIVTHIRKPFGPKKLESALQYCLDEQKRLYALEHEWERELEFDDEFVTSSSTTVGSLAVTPLTPPFREMDGMFFGLKIADAAQDQPAAPPAPKSTPTASKERPNVLAVEDNNINLMLLSTFLKKYQYPFECATNGLEALQKIQNTEVGHFDIILIDIMMPIMSGVEATREIRKLEAARGIPRSRRLVIVALTGLAALSDQQAAFDAGVDNFMVKPVNFSELGETLELAVEERLRMNGSGRVNDMVEVDLKDIHKTSSLGMKKMEKELKKQVSITSCSRSRIEMSQTAGPKGQDRTIINKSMQSKVESTVSYRQKPPPIPEKKPELLRKIMASKEPKSPPKLPPKDCNVDRFLYPEAKQKPFSMALSSPGKKLRTDGLVSPVVKPKPKYVVEAFKHRRSKSTQHRRTRSALSSNTFLRDLRAELRGEEPSEIGRARCHVETQPMCSECRR